jgi:hypothetical protein
LRDGLRSEAQDEKQSSNKKTTHAQPFETREGIFSQQVVTISTEPEVLLRPAAGADGQRVTIV